MAQYIYDKFGKFPGKIPSVFNLMLPAGTPS